MALLRRANRRERAILMSFVDLRKTLGFEFIALADRLEAKLGRKVDIATFEHFKRSSHSPRYRHVAEDIKRSLIYVK